MIDAKTGHLLIDKERKITPQTSLTTLEAWQLGNFQKTQQMGNAWNWVEVKNLSIDQFYLNISFLFKNTQIDGFTFVFQEEPYDLNPSWDSWAKEVEESNLVRFKEWLEEKFGKKRAFDWGSIEAFYDAKSGGSLIQVRYI